MSFQSRARHLAGLFFEGDTSHAFNVFSLALWLLTTTVLFWGHPVWLTVATLADLTMYAAVTVSSVRGRRADVSQQRDSD